MTESLKQIYILAGNDTVGREHARGGIIESISRNHGQVTSVRFDTGDGDFSLFAQDILTPSLFQETRVFLIGHAQELGEKEISQLNQLLDNPPPDCYLIIEIDEDKKGKESEPKTAKKLGASRRAAEGGCSYMEFPKPPEYRISQWLQSQVPLLFGRKISKSDADYLADLVGSDLDTLHSELQKIDIHLPAGRAIGHSAIEHVVGASRQMTVYELASALSQKQFPKALAIINSLFSTDFYAPLMISAFFRHYWALFRIRRFAEANPQVVKTFLSSRGYKDPAVDAAAYDIGLASGLLHEGEQRKVYPVIIASGIVQSARKFSDEELKTVLRWLLEFDAGVKTGKIEATEHEVQLFCFKIARVSELIRS
ncbi:MAG: DNA polymerase III subunit delta [Fibrobacter sp.]|jgi:DNA polymerase III delta subunit|nr:DNA polymerase III subunit delta [Fibrobacter sp.]